ncbi:hypothetical protein LEMA_P114470.1 [Plenodomus lingam JN3]|uniref:Mitochondrial inner membrane protein Mba1 n=1 Tax=Leptosphaeria maculans (strain JN3 / isolate v23.1.3 / race Av1-4-5-6-7-8) TaxID=985895 RepID=E4ZUF3_LEPMJ|nr:hypothetical protein LEMA_P114470.1 [Plenodomus lingam JN3]CBX95032.1 hypothetical protein LEMA_P114470.1 [Plenodomus lingam JN3]
MSTQIPLRSVRIPALQRQCLFLRHQRLNRPFAAAASRAFSSTPSQAAKKSFQIGNPNEFRAAARSQVGRTPGADLQRMQQIEEALVEDIGILQGTIVRAPVSKLPKITTKAFWEYYWALLKSKGTSLWSRSVHRRMIQKVHLSRFLPVDFFKNEELKGRAKNMYTHMYTKFAEGDHEALQKICLPPLARQFQDRITARGNLKVTWKLHEWKSVKIVSHRSAALGGDQVDTAYRQAIIRLDSLQSVTRKQIDDAISAAVKARGVRTLQKQPAWIPEEARQKLKQNSKEEEEEEEGVEGAEGAEKNKNKNKKKSETSSHEEFAGNGEIKRVVEYLVLQKRAIRGTEEGWKILGFTEESTPETLKSDEEYWGSQLTAQAAKHSRA